jgi:hypothetical protein
MPLLEPSKKMAPTHVGGYGSLDSAGMIPASGSALGFPRSRVQPPIFPDLRKNQRDGNYDSDGSKSPGHD